MDLDRFAAAIQDVINALIGRKLDALALYPARVVQQTGNFVEVVADDARLPGMPPLPIYSGTPGVTAEVPEGTRVLIGFTSGDLSKPFVAMWESISPKPEKVVVDADEIKLGANALLGVARIGDSVGPYVITSASTTVKAE